MASVLIAGCGYVGCEFAQLLLAKNHTVYGLRRNTALLPKGVIPLASDLTRLTAADLPSAIDYIFYLAAADESSEPAYYRAYQQGLANLLASLSQAGHRPKRIFFSSSTAVYAQHSGEWVDETSATKPDDYKGKILLAAETQLAESGYSHVIVRFGGIYGPGRDRLIRQVASGNASLTQDDMYTNRIHLKDCAGVLLHLLELDRPETLYLAVDHEPVLKNEVIKWLANQLKVRVVQKASLNSEEQTQRANKRCSNQRLLASGYQFHQPSFRQGYASLIADLSLRENKNLS